MVNALVARIFSAVHCASTIFVLKRLFTGRGETLEAITSDFPYLGKEASSPAAHFLYTMAVVFFTLLFLAHTLAPRSPPIKMLIAVSFVLLCIALTVLSGINIFLPAFEQGADLQSQKFLGYYGILVFHYVSAVVFVKHWLRQDDIERAKRD